ncbi:apolipoprotein L1-like [Xenentodon cancila]
MDSDAVRVADQDGAGSPNKRREKKFKMAFVSRRGSKEYLDTNASTREDGEQNGMDYKTNAELKGAHGYTPPKGSKDKSPDFGSHACTPHEKLQDVSSEDLKKMRGQTFQPAAQENMLDDASMQKKKSSLLDEELDDEELNKIKDSKWQKRKTANGARGFSYREPQQKSGEFDQDVRKRADSSNPEKVQDEELDEQDLDKLSTATHAELEDAPGATSSDYLSEAAKAEWMAAQMDERALAGMEDDDEGDTDSLMEWWYTVEQWDEVPSDEEDAVMKEDELKSFMILADKVNRGLRVFYKVFTERAEVLWQSIIMLHTIAEDISEFHHKAKIAGITGGTTTAVGGITAIAGLALAPFTFGVSLVVTAVGVGVATAGGITSASAAISDNVNNMQDRKKVEVVLKEYEEHLVDIGKILHFINQGLYKLRGHPFLRSGTQHYSEDWEIRRAVQMISLVDSPVMRATELADAAVASLQRLFKGMDKYFIKETRELKKGCRKEIVGEIQEVANLLNNTIVELNAIREELQAATGIV